MPHSPHLARLIALLALLAMPALAQADRFTLTSGGVIEGTLLNRQQLPRVTYEVRTSAGVTIVLKAAQVAEFTQQGSAIDEYKRLAPTFPDGVKGQWELAEWCRQHQLPSERARHLQRVIEIQPDHVEARHGLGYMWFAGKWTTTSDAMAERGYIRYAGKFRSRQDIALLQEEAKAKQAYKEWLAKLKTLRGQLNDPKLANSAYEQLAAVRDPVAIGPLVEMCEREASLEVKTLYIEVLSKMKSGVAIEALVYITLNDGDVEVFHVAAETLQRLRPPHLSEPYLKALDDANNVRLNRAAYMLGAMGDRSAIDPLIEKLLTTHRVATAPAPRGGDAITTGFSSTGGSSFQTGAAPRELSITVQNRAVLDALTKLAGGPSFGYDAAAWRKWQAAEKGRKR